MSKNEQHDIKNLFCQTRTRLEPGEMNIYK